MKIESEHPSVQEEGIPLQIERPDFTPELKRFGGLALAWAIGFAFFELDHLRLVRHLPAGILTGFLECAIEAAIIFSLLSKRKAQSREYRYFLWFFCLLLPADISYLSLHYFFRSNDETWTTFLLTTLPYTAAYFFGAVGFFKHIRAKFNSRRSAVRALWLPAVLVVPALFGILAPLLHARYASAGWSFDFLEIAFNSAFSIAFFFWSSSALMNSLDPAFSFAGLAGIVSQLGNWGGVSAYLLNKNTFTFSEYEFLWLCGLIAFWYAFVVIKNPEDSPLEGDIPGAQGLSLAVQQRMTIIGLISAFLIGAALIFHHGERSYRIVLFGIAIGSFIALLVGEVLSKQIIRYAMMFGRVVSPAKNQLDEREIPLELRQAYRAVFHKDVMSRRTEEVVQKNLAELSSQVAHDIRSPLAALDSVIKDASQLPEEKRLIIRSAVSRIRDIANNLLDKRRESIGSKAIASPVGAVLAEEPASICLLSSLIEPLMTEKRLQYRSRIGLEIDSGMDESSYGLFARVQPVEFRRVLSNLIDNAVEAMGELKSGRVSLALSARGNWVSLGVQDNGRGITRDVLPRLGRKGESHGKSRGSGLGLYHAKTRVESWGGQLRLASKIGEGTLVIVELPKAPAPDWFISELWLHPDEAVVVLDDDASIHQVWQERFESLGQERSASVLHFSTPKEIRDWASQNPKEARLAVYLMDYELLGYAETGLSLAKELGIGERTVLVTSRFDEPEILEECLKLGVRMIPKGLAVLAPIRLAQSPERIWDAVLIDDDPLVRMTWKHAASGAGKKLLSFSSPAEFFRALSGIHRKTAIYIDQELGGQITGIQAAARMTEFGFTEIYLATGHKGIPRRELEHLKGVVGKEPPWQRTSELNPCHF